MSQDRKEQFYNKWMIQLKLENNAELGEIRFISLSIFAEIILWIQKSTQHKWNSRLYFTVTDPYHDKTERSTENLNAC